MHNALIVLSTCEHQKQAEEIAKSLIENRLAACIQVLPHLVSFYRWKDTVKQANEVQLVIKTRRSLFDALCTQLKTVHPYEIPEIIAIPVENGSTDYLSWLYDETMEDKNNTFTGI